MCDEGIRNTEGRPEPLVSVLVPSYNHEKYVIECLESIKNLTYRRLELIVSDDCSQDGTFALAEQWAQKNAGRFERILVVRQEKNVGLVANLQYLFNSALGDYLAYIASDDVFMETAIERRLKMLQHDRDIDAVFANAQLVSESGTVLKEEFIPKRIARELSSQRLLISSLLLNWCVPGPVMMLRKRAVLEIGSLGLLPVDLKAEDRYIYIRMAALGKLRFVNEIVAKWRAVPGSFCRPHLKTNMMLEDTELADRKNRHLLSGVNRIALENRVARIILELRKNNSAFYRFRVFILRCVSTSLRVALLGYALIVKGRYQLQFGGKRS